LLPQLPCCCVITDRHHHHMSGPALNGTMLHCEADDAINYTMASGEQRGVSDLKAAVGWKPGHPLHKNIDRLHFAALPPSECLTLSG